MHRTHEQKLAGGNPRILLWSTLLSSCDTASDPASGEQTPVQCEKDCDALLQSCGGETEVSGDPDRRLSAPDVACNAGCLRSSAFCFRACLGHALQVITWMEERRAPDSPHRHT
jgi:hypothetical protein